MQSGLFRRVEFHSDLVGIIGTLNFPILRRRLSPTLFDDSDL
jgi:hypothetical protein